MKLLHIVFTSQEHTHIVVASPRFVTFDVEVHPHP